MKNVESVVRRDDVQDGSPPRYDCQRGRVELMLEPVGEDELRSRLSRALFGSSVSAGKPFTHGAASDEMEIADLTLSSYLIHPSAADRVRDTVPPGFPVYESDAAPRGSVLALCEPEYLGVLAVRGSDSGFLVYGTPVRFSLATAEELDGARAFLEMVLGKKLA